MELGNTHMREQTEKVMSSTSGQEPPSTRSATKAPPSKQVTPLTPPPTKRKRVSESAKGIGYSVGFVGCGNMARALTEGMIASGE